VPCFLKERLQKLQKLTTGSRVLLEKLVVTQLAKKIPHLLSKEKV